MVLSFSATATVALVVVVLAGGAMTAMIEPDVIRAGTSWTRSWWTKVVLAAIAGALGGHHHFRVRPRLAAGRETDRVEASFRRGVVVEAALLTAVAVASAVLVTASLV